MENMPSSKRKELSEVEKWVSSILDEESVKIYALRAGESTAGRTLTLHKLDLSWIPNTINGLPSPPSVIPKQSQMWCKNNINIFFSLTSPSQ